MASSTPSPLKKTVFLLDDHPLVLFSLDSLLSQDIRYQVVGNATNLAAAQKCLMESPAELVICEAVVTDGETLGLIRWLSSHSPKSKVLVYSILDDSQIARFRQAGAAAYVHKSSPLLALFEAMETVLSGNNCRWDSSQKLLDPKQLDIAADTGRTLKSLTDREQEIFVLTGQGMTSREIAERLGISRKTVEAHRQNIRQTLKLKNMRELIRFAALHRATFDAGN